MVVQLAVGLALMLKEIHPREALAAGLWVVDAGGWGGGSGSEESAHTHYKCTPPHEAVSAWRVCRPGSMGVVWGCYKECLTPLQWLGWFTPSNSPHSTPVDPSHLAGEAILVPVGADGREVGSHDGSVTALARWGELVEVVLLAVGLAILLIEVEVVLFKRLATQ